MAQLLASPPVGANFACSLAPWRIFMSRGDGWVPVGACGDETLVREHVKSLERFIPTKEFKVVFNGAGIV